MDSTVRYSSCTVRVRYSPDRPLLAESAAQDVQMSRRTGMSESDRTLVAAQYLVARLSKALYLSSKRLCEA
jgi:hypothetical protein